MASRTIGAAEFKAHCLRILDEVERTGEPVTITKRGRPVAEVKPVENREGKSIFGLLKGSVIWRGDPEESGFDPDWEKEWDANNPPELYR